MTATVVLGGQSARERSSSASVISRDLLADIEMIRAEGGRSEEQLESLYWQNDFAQAVTRLQEINPGGYTSSWTDSDDGSFWVAVPGVLSPRAARILGALPVEVNVVEGMPWTEAELVEAVERVHYGLLNAPGIRDVETGGDPLTGAITSTVQPESTDSARASGLDIDVRALGTRIDERFTHEVQVVSELDSGADALYGGSQLGNACTAGFSVRTATYGNGMLTAEHCGNSASIGDNTLTYRGRANFSRGDVQWHSSNKTTGASFHISSTARRAITSTANPIDGNTYCRYGRTTGGQCDEVYMLNRCRGDYCGLVMMFHREADGGDSGGPWYLGNNGYGIHSGYSTYLTLRRDMWSPVRAAVQNIGVAVKLA